MDINGIEVRSYDRDDYISVWVGKCNTDKQFYGYIRGNYDEDGNFSSGLASDFGIMFYDEDFSMVNFCDAPTSDLTVLLDTGVPDYVIEHFTEKYGQNLTKEYNFCVMFYDLDYKYGAVKTVNQDFGEVLYLGSMPASKTDLL